MSLSCGMLHVTLRKSAKFWLLSKGASQAKPRRVLAMLVVALPVALLEPSFKIGQLLAGRAPQVLG